jgi:hypothetical protein
MACRWRSLRLCCSLSDFGGQIYKFSPSSGGHAPVNCVRRQSLVLQPLSAVVQSLGDRCVAFTRLGWFSVRIAREGCKPGFFAVVWWIWLFGGSWRFRACAATGGGFPGRDFPPLSFSCFVLVCVCLDNLLCTYINLVIGSRPECVTDSLFQ